MASEHEENGMRWRRQAHVGARSGAVLEYGILVSVRGIISAADSDTPCVSFNTKVGLH